MTQPLSHDRKLKTVFAEQDTAKLTQLLKKGYLNSRPITMLFDLSSKAEFTIILNFQGNIAGISTENKTLTSSKKSSVTPFALRKVSHAIKLWMNIGGYRELKAAQIEKIIAAYQLALTKKPLAPSHFGTKAFMPLPEPKEFESTLITLNQLDDLLEKHRSLLEKEGPGTHGMPLPNIRMAFENGTIQTTQRGITPIIENNPQANVAFIQQIRQVITLISEEEDPAIQSLFMLRLASQFTGCSVDRAGIVQTLLNEFLGKGSKTTFEARLDIKLNQFKKSLFEQLLTEKYPQDQGNPSHLQLPHLSSGYLTAVGKQFGLQGLAAANHDRHAYRVSNREKREFAKEFTNRFQASLDVFCLELLTEINNKDEDITEKYSIYRNQRVNNGDLPEDFGYYTDEKKDKGLYETLEIPPTEEQEDFIYSYTSPSELKHLLGLMGILE